MRQSLTVHESDGDMSLAPRVLVTGGTGFIGRTAVAHLLDGRQYRVRASVRTSSAALLPKDAEVGVCELAADADWRQTLSDVSIVLHTAGTTRVGIRDRAAALAELRSADVAGTLNLARQAADAGVQRFVFLSSIKVHGETSRFGEPISVESPLAPEDPYAITKLETEQLLQRHFRDSATELVIVRPPLVYGPGVKGHFATLIRWLAKGLPLPLGAVWNNRRSLLALDNLVDLLATCVHHPAAANKVFLASDGEDVSTTDLLSRIARAMQREPRLIPVPVEVLRAAFRLARRQSISHRLLDSLQVDTTATRATLAWVPPLSLDEGLFRSVANLVAAERPSEPGRFNGTG
jgi:UDP-4-keto-D-QuiNAc 4-reductase